MSRGWVSKVNNLVGVCVNVCAKRGPASQALVGQFLRVRSSYNSSSYAVNTSGGVVVGVDCASYIRVCGNYSVVNGNLTAAIN